MNLFSVIIHCDLDCFYAQVERERLQLPADACVVVVQWKMALAVSYPARKFGIKRGSDIEEIKEAAGDKVTIVKVETIGAGHSSGPEAESEASDANANANDENSSAKEEKDVQGREKVSLARYRKASAEVFAAIFEALKSYNAKLERASIDEAYIDVTAEVDRRMRLAEETREMPVDTVVVGEKLDLSSESDVRLAYGADISAEVRKKVFEKCNYTMSGGISVNKLLAKFASAENKPNKQTIVPENAISDLMKDVPLKKLRGLGGKLGEKVVEMGVTTAGEATELTLKALIKQLGRRKDAEFVFNCVRGKDESQVVERDATKSLLAAKSFKPERSLDVLEKQWLPLLAAELTDRMKMDSEVNKRDAKTLTISFRVKQAEKKGLTQASRSIPMPPNNNDDWAKEIAEAALHLMQNVLDEAQFRLPINFIGLTANNFNDRAKPGESITNYFSAAAQEKPEDELTQPSISDVSQESINKRRRQERADLEMARRLHRFESTKGTKKPPKKVQKTEPGDSKQTSKRKMASRSVVTTLDAFFKSQPKR